MKIVVIGGSGLIGSLLVARLTGLGHQVNAASPASGVNTVTAEGLQEALNGADVVVDVSNSPSFDDKEVMRFFETSAHNLFAAENMAGVMHHVVLSVVGTDRLQESGYFRAKQVQENLVRASGIPYTIVHSTQFFEFLGGIASAATEGTIVRLSPALIQPIASADVAEALKVVTLSSPLNGIAEIAGPNIISLSALVAQYLARNNDHRKVIEDVHARYYGAELTGEMLLPGKKAHLYKTDFEKWYAKQPKRPQQIL